MKEKSNRPVRPERVHHHNYSIKPGETTEDLRLDLSGNWKWVTVSPGSLWCYKHSWSVQYRKGQNF